MDKSDTPSRADTPAIDSPVEASAIDDLVAQLRSRVDERQRNGDYPEGLEQALDAHFRRIVFHRARAENATLDAAVSSFDSRSHFSRQEIAADSGVPGGEMLHKAINKVVARQRQDLLDQMSDFADAVRDVVHALADAVRDPSTHVHADIVGRIDAVLERLHSYESRPSSDDAAIGDLRRRIEDLERAVTTRDRSAGN